ncbi:MAG: PadR family transcriptional regulator [Gemmatimonas sp.]
MPTDPRSLLPLRPVEFLLLLALVEAEQHGYALAKEIAERTDGVVTLEPGNLYRVIKRLRDDNLVEASTRKSDVAADDERRRYYKLTKLGQQVAALEGERLRKLLASKPARELARIAGSRA